MSVHVTHQQQDGRQQARSAVRYTLGVAHADKGLRISYGAYLPYLYVPGALPTEQHGMRARLAGLLPGLMVDSQGNFKRLPDLQRITRKARLRALRVDRKGRRLAASVLSDRALSLAARRFWDDRVGRWHGHGELERGKVYEEKHELHIPELGDATVAAVTRYHFADWVACDQKASSKQCVQVELETAPDPQAMAEAIATFAKRHQKRKRKPRDRSVRDIEQRTRVQIITEPSTLRPRRYSEERFSMLGLRDSQGHETQTMRTDRLVEVYSY